MADPTPGQSRAGVTDDAVQSQTVSISGSNDSEDMLIFEMDVEETIKNPEEDLQLNTMGAETVNTEGEWVKVTAVVDSGAEDNALPPDTAEWFELTPSEASKAERKFRGAAGEPIPAMGRRVTKGKTAEGHTKRISWEVCPVKKPLLSVPRLTEAGNVVKIGKNKAIIVNSKTKQVTHLRKERKVWLLDIWLWKPAGFCRQEK